MLSSSNKSYLRSSAVVVSAEKGNFEYALLLIFPDNYGCTFAFDESELDAAGITGNAAAAAADDDDDDVGGASDLSNAKVGSKFTIYPTYEWKFFKEIT